MLSYAFQRLLLLIPTFIGVSLIAFDRSGWRSGDLAKSAAGGLEALAPPETGGWIAWPSGAQKG
jgi:hypothetical protein